MQRCCWCGQMVVVYNYFSKDGTINKPHWAVKSSTKHLYKAKKKQKKTIVHSGQGRHLEKYFSHKYWASNWDHDFGRKKKKKPGLYVSVEGQRRRVLETTMQMPTFAPWLDLICVFYVSLPGLSRSNHVDLSRKESDSSTSGTCSVDFKLQASLTLSLLAAILRFRMLPLPKWAITITRAISY